MKIPLEEISLMSGALGMASQDGTREGLTRPGKSVSVDTPGGPEARGVKHGEYQNR